MKRIICLILAVVLILLCTACGSFEKVDLQEAIAIPENGMIEENILAQMQTICNNLEDADLAGTPKEEIIAAVSAYADAVRVMQAQASEVA